MADKRTTIPRREFLTWVAKGTSFVLGGLFGCATAITYRGAVVGGRIAMARSELEQLGAFDKPVVVRTPDLPAPVILIPIDSENFRAVSAECTHLGCHVRPSGKFLVCPCHGSTFNLAGEIVRGPAPSPLPIYPVETKENQIEIIIF